MMANTITAPLIALLFGTTFVMSAGQILLKMSSQRLAESGGPIYSLLFSPIFIFAAVVYSGAIFAWVYVLKTVPLVYAHSFTALTFLMVPLMAYAWLGETLSWQFIFGVLVIIAGLLIVQTA